MDNQEIKFNIMTDKQEMVLSINQIEHKTPQELAHLLDVLSEMLRQLPNEMIAELKKQDEKVSLDTNISIQLNKAKEQKKLKATEHNVGGLRLILGGLMAISLIILQDYVAMGQLDIPTFISIVSFALAIPLMAGLLFISFREAALGYFGYSRLISAIIYISVFVDIIGIATAIWHISWIAGIIFIASGIFMLVVSSDYIEKNKLNPPKTEEIK